MALVLMTKTRQRLAIGQSDPTLRPFQGLNGRFFIDGKDERILGRIEIKTHNVGRLAGKLRVRRNAPTVAPFQFDALLAQNAPDLIGGNIGQLLGNQPPIPASITRRWVSIKELQHPFDCDFIIFGRLATARGVLQASDSVTQKPPAPLADRDLGNAQSFGNLTSTATFRRLENNLTPYFKSMFHSLRSTPTLQQLAIFHIKFDSTGCHPPIKSQSLINIKN